MSVPGGQTKEQEIELTKSERRLFARLMENKPDVVTRDELMMELWNTDEYVTDAALTTIISRLRAKLKMVCGEEVIFTKKGKGILYNDCVSVAKEKMERNYGSFRDRSVF